MKVKRRSTVVKFVYEMMTKHEQKHLERIEKKVDDIIKQSQKTAKYFAGELKDVHEKIDDVQRNTQQNTTNNEWMMRFFWIFMTAVLGGVVMIFFNTFIK